MIPPSHKSRSRERSGTATVYPAEWDRVWKGDCNTKAVSYEGWFTVNTTFFGISLSNLEAEHPERHTRESSQTLSFCEAEKMNTVSIDGTEIVRLHIKNTPHILVLSTCV